MNQMHQNNITRLTHESTTPERIKRETPDAGMREIHRQNGEHTARNPGDYTTVDAREKKAGKPGDAFGEGLVDAD